MYDAIIAFIEENWSAFCQICEEREIDQEEALEIIRQAQDKYPEYLFIKNR